MLAARIAVLFSGYLQQACSCCCRARQRRRCERASLLNFPVVRKARKRSGVARTRICRRSSLVQCVSRLGDGRRLGGFGTSDVRAACARCEQLAYMRADCASGLHSGATEGVDSVRAPSAARAIGATGTSSDSRCTRRVRAAARTRQVRLRAEHVDIYGPVRGCLLHEHAFLRRTGRTEHTETP